MTYSNLIPAGNNVANKTKSRCICGKLSRAFSKDFVLFFFKIPFLILLWLAFIYISISFKFPNVFLKQSSETMFNILTSGYSGTNIDSNISFLLKLVSSILI